MSFPIRNPAFPFLYPAIFEESYGKKQILLHLGMKKSKERFAELIKDADVLVWGYAPGSLDRLGFTREALMELNPNLVLTHVTAYGPDGTVVAAKRLGAIVANLFRHGGSRFTGARSAPPGRSIAVRLRNRATSPPSERSRRSSSDRSREGFGTFMLL